MSKNAFDPSKFRRSLTKSITGMSAGFHDPSIWVDTGNYVLNYLISGNFKKGVPLGKVSVFAGESGCLPDTARVRIRSKLDPALITQITVKELDDLFHSENKDNFELATPDGYVDIINWFNKGKLSMVRLVTASHKTTCAVNHLIQTPAGHWFPAYKLRVGDHVKTESGNETIIRVEKKEPQLCYDFEVDHPNHRYWGDGFSSHNSGKSYVCAGNIAKDAQQQGIFVVLIDTENALDEEWLKRLGVDTSEDKLLKLNMAMVDDVAKTISTFMKDYKEMEPADRPPVLFVVDSLGMLMTPTEVNQFDSGDMKGDMGRKAKALKALVTNCVNMFGEYNVGMVATNHTYASQNMYDPDQVVSGGSGVIFASSIVVVLSKLKLKEDSDGNKVSDVLGIRSGCKVVKTRYNKPFESVEVHIPYDTGMSRYSGLFEFFVKKGLITRSGMKWEYTSLDGSILSKRKKAWSEEMLDQLMDEYPEKNRQIATEQMSSIELFADEDLIETSLEDNNNE